MSDRLFPAKVDRVIDGDTICCDIDLGFGVFRQDAHCRLACINAPEMSTPEGPPARDHLMQLLLVPSGHTFKSVTLRIPKNRWADKYGRYLVIVTLGDISEADTTISLNTQMVSDGFAKDMKYSLHFAEE